MKDQAQSLRELVLSKKKELNNVNSNNKNTSKNSCKTIMFASGRSKEGKSNIIINLSIMLQKLGCKVLIIDENRQNMDVMMGICCKYTMLDVIYKDKSIDEALTNGPFGVKLLMSGFNISNIEIFTDEQRSKLINGLEQIDNFDYVLININSGIDKNVLGFAAVCKNVVLVTTGDPKSITSTYSVIKAFKHFKLNNDFYIIMNKFKNNTESELIYKKLSFTVKKFLNIDISSLGSISDDEIMIASAKKKKPLVLNYPNSKASKNITLLAQNMVNNFDMFEPMTIANLFKKIFLIF